MEGAPRYLASSVKELSDSAASKLPPVDRRVPILRYFNSGNEIIRQAKIYQNEENWELAYLMLMKYALLVLERLPNHPEYGTVPKEQQILAKKKVSVVVADMEKIKPHLNKMYEAKKKNEEEMEAKRQERERYEQQRLKEENERREAEELYQQQLRQQQLEQEHRNLNQLQYYGKLVQQQQLQEIKQFNPSSTIVREPPQPSLEQLPSREVKAQYPNVPLDYNADNLINYNPSRPSAPSLPQPGPSSDMDSPFGQAPSTQQLEPFRSQLPLGAYPTPPLDSAPPYSMHQPPSLPQEPLSTMSSMGSSLPFPLPPLYVPSDGPPASSSSLPPPSSSASQRATAPVAPSAPVNDRKVPSKDSTVGSQSGSSPAPISEPVQEGLRTVVIDGEIFTAFMRAVESNTKRAIETCGILTGTLRKNVFYITHIIIPKQTGSSDMCAMTNEDEVFTFQDTNDLMTLGWIHTHPTHACFMSSVDLHTHSSYQFLLPESIAVVAAPQYTPKFSSS